MKTLKRLTVLLLAALMLLSFCACGSGSTDGTSGGGDGGNEDAKIWMKDFELLKEHGYSVNLERSNLFMFEDSIKAGSGMLAALISASNEKEGKVILIYYFKSEDDAKNVFATLDPVYKLAGTRIVHGDQDDLIK